VKVSTLLQNVQDNLQQIDHFFINIILILNWIMTLLWATRKF